MFSVFFCVCVNIFLFGTRELTWNLQSILISIKLEEEAQKKDNNENNVYTLNVQCINVTETWSSFSVECTKPSEFTKKLFVFFLLQADVFTRSQGWISVYAKFWKSIRFKKTTIYYSTAGFIFTLSQRRWYILHRFVCIKSSKPLFKIFFEKQITNFFWIQFLNLSKYFLLSNAWKILSIRHENCKNTYF